MRDYNFKMVTLARESRGLTQSQLAALISGLNQGNLSKMEKGILNLNDETITKIAKQLDYPLEFFRKEEPKQDINKYYYRKRQTIPKKNLMAIEAKIDIIRLSIDELLDSIDIPVYKLNEIEPDGGITPEDIARHTRNILGIPKGAIENPVSYIENAGVMVYFLDEESEKFDGITVHTNSGYPIIFMNKNMPNDRKRFTLGHELGHLIMHLPFSSIRNSDEVEQEANRFSSEFNMPTVECQVQFRNLRYNDLGMHKSYWKMSKAAIIRKAKDINVISEKTYSYLNIELSRRNERKNEIGSVSIDEPKLIPAMVKAHKNELGYSVQELSQILAISIKDFQRLFENKIRILNIV